MILFLPVLHFHSDNESQFMRVLGEGARGDTGAAQQHRRSLSSSLSFCPWPLIRWEKPNPSRECGDILRLCLYCLCHFLKSTCCHHFFSGYSPMGHHTILRLTALGPDSSKGHLKPKSPKSQRWILYSSQLLFSLLPLSSFSPPFKEFSFYNIFLASWSLQKLHLLTLPSALY